jgi:hypothetical protein
MLLIEKYLLALGLVVAACACSKGSGSSAGSGGSASNGGSSSSGGASGSAGGASGGQSGSAGGGGGTSETGGSAGSSGGAGGEPTGTGGGEAGGAGDGSAEGDGGGSSLVCRGPAVSEDPGRRRAAARPDVPADSCTDTNWVLTNGVCCASYCSDDDKSENCKNCKGTDKCVTVNSKACTSGEWPEVHCVTDDEPWHYSRSTHFGLTSGGACAFGLYGLCTKSFKFTDPNLATQCDTFCKAWPDLCRDPDSVTLRGNFAAPPGHYYTQFWPSLPGDNDNYLSCGECFELVHTKKDGTDYQPGEAGYTPSVVLQIVDSCPCSANSKWCCGSGRDHCAEVSDFKYGCQLPPAPPPPPVDRDPLPNESLHLDLSDIAMARLQNGDANKEIVDGVIPTRYRRVPCPVKGNIHILLKNGGEYYFAFSVVNMAGVGSLVNVEARLPSGEWVSLKRDPNYKSYQPQERFGTWVLPQGKGPFSLPLALRFTDPSGKQVTSEQAIKDWNPPATSDAALAKLLKDFYYIDTGVQF